MKLQDLGFFFLTFCFDIILDPEELKEESENSHIPFSQIPQMFMRERESKNLNAVLNFTDFVSINAMNLPKVILKYLYFLCTYLALEILTGKH